MYKFRLPIPVKPQMLQVWGTSIYYPQILWAPTLNIKNHVNRVIYQEVIRLFNNIVEMGYFQPGKSEFTGDYEIKNNQRGILSLTLSNFIFTEHMAHPADNLTALTTDLRTGKFFSLQELFKPGSNYVERINKLVKLQVEERDMDLFEGFKGINPDQDYYIADQCLVIFFQRYEIGPRPLGYPMFPIPIYQLEDIVKEDGPLGIMLWGDT